MGKNICFKLTGIATTEFAIIDSILVKEENISLNTGIEFSVNINDNNIGVEPKFIFSSDNQPFMIIGVRCNFYITKEGLDEILIDNKYIFPLGFITHLSVIAVGTARGVLHSKTENTPYNKYLIPTINLTEIIKSDLVIEKR